MLYRLLPVAILAAVAAVSAAPPQQVLPLDRADRLTVYDTRVEPVTHRGRKALKMIEQQVNHGLGLAILNGVEFGNGTIETAIAGQPAGGAAEGSRGFVGIAFRVQKDPTNYECFYLRPTNGRADDQLRRNHATQYVSEPGFPWQKLRQENPGVYESYVDLEPGAWTPIRIVVEGVKARLYVHGAAQPALIVNDLKQAPASGGVALWIGAGTEGFFRNLTVTSGAPTE